MAGGPRPLVIDQVIDQASGPFWAGLSGFRPRARRQKQVLRFFSFEFPFGVDE
jgi:hypothetical protein